MKRRLFTIIGLFLFLSEASWSQSYIQPNYGLKSHETLVINKVEATTKATTFYLTIENRITGGTFCADQNIFIVYPDGTRSKMISSNGIPVCPDSHKFRTPVEKLDFTLTFPPLNKDVEWVDLVEDCTQDCFHFYGVTLDNSLNQKINEAFQLAENDDPVKAMISFIDILESTGSRNIGAEGLLYVNIVNLAKQSGNVGQAVDWYKKLKNSGAPRLQDYIKFLNDQGIKY
ncbi:MAG: hypothetical protein NT092_14240 [Bacteroidia bacterium]|nr:hypothetical protein [Bacteroidia bacterium]